MQRLGRAAMRFLVVAQRGALALARAVVERFPVAVTAFSVLYLGAVAIRVVVYRLQASEGGNALSFDTQWTTLPGFLGLAEGDAWWSGWSAVLVGVAELLGRRRRWPAIVLGAFVVSLGSVISIAHAELLFAMQTGLSWEAMGELIYAPSPGDMQDALRGWHLAFLPGATILFLALALAGRTAALGAAIAAVLAMLAMFGTEYVKGDRKWVFAALREHGALFLAREVRKNWWDASHVYLDRPVSLSSRQAQTLALVDDVFSDPGASPGPAFSPLAGATRPVNVVLVVLESTAFQDANSLRPDGSPLMPFLQSLRARGAWAARHHATANSSASAAFSMVTGLFPMPEMAVYAMRPDIELPALPRLLGRPTEAFLVTPSRLESFFPRPLLARNGFEDVEGYYNLPPEALGQYITKATRDERTVIAYFRERVLAASQPFFAVYYSYMPHFNYNDYGTGTHVFEPADRHSRYLNNLAMLDGLLAGFVGSLEEAGRLEDTLLVVAGDHGEAFGQHPKNATHARFSYEENVAVPFVMVHPPSIPPTEIGALTSHADLPPTVLDLVGVPYDPAQFQGHSLVRAFPPGRRTFAMGNEGALVTWREDGRKTILNTRKDTCQAFDLATDPGEQVDLGCIGNDAEVDALLAWRLHQVRDVKARNAELRAALLAGSPAP